MASAGPSPSALAAVLADRGAEATGEDAGSSARRVQAMASPRLPLLTLLVASLAAMWAPPHVHAAALAALDPSGCIPPGKFVLGRNYFPSTFFKAPFARAGKSAFRFAVRYQKHYKLVQDLIVGTKYVLYQCGAPEPNLGPAYVYLQIPLSQGYTLPDDVPANFLQLLGATKGLRYIPPGSVVNPCFQKLAAGLSQPAPGTALPAINSYVDVTDPIGLNVSFSATSESSPLRRTQWIKYLSFFFNKEPTANAAYNTISKYYYCLLKRAKRYVVYRKRRRQRQPVAAWVSFYDGLWTVSGALYKLHFIQDAGGVYPRQVTSGSDTIYSVKDAASLAKFKALLKGLDVVLDESFLPQGPQAYSLEVFKANAQISDAEVKSYRFLARSWPPNVWNIYGQYSMGAFPITNWYEAAVAQPQIVLQDLAAIFYPALFPRGFRTSILYNVYRRNAQQLTTSNCSVSDLYGVRPPVRVHC